jgi:hypothetical protein
MLVVVVVLTRSSGRATSSEEQGVRFDEETRR